MNLVGLPASTTLPGKTTMQKPSVASSLRGSEGGGRGRHRSLRQSWLRGDHQRSLLHQALASRRAIPQSLNPRRQLKNTNPIYVAERGLELPYGVYGRGFFIISMKERCAGVSSFFFLWMRARGRRCLPPLSLHWAICLRATSF